MQAHRLKSHLSILPSIKNTISVDFIHKIDYPFPHPVNYSSFMEISKFFHSRHVTALKQYLYSFSINIKLLLEDLIFNFYINFFPPFIQHTGKQTILICQNDCHCVSHLTMNLLLHLVLFLFFLSLALSQQCESFPQLLEHIAPFVGKGTGNSVFLSSIPVSHAFSLITDLEL